VSSGARVGRPAPIAVGALLVLGAVVAFAALTARVCRRHRLDGLEGPLTLALGGVFFLLQATILGLRMVFGLEPTPARLEGLRDRVAPRVGGRRDPGAPREAPVALGLDLVAGGAPSEAGGALPALDLAGRGNPFAVGVETLLNGVLRGAELLTLLGALLLVGSALTACVAAAVTLSAGVPALQARAT
jgi:hypothetical protein